MMVTNLEINSYISTIDWTQEGLTLKEFIQNFDLPQVGKVIKGQFENIGLPSISSPYSKPIIILFNGGKIIKIAATCVKFKEERNHFGLSHCQPILFGYKLAIPFNYCGYFEILSEEGKSVKYVKNVHELIHHFPSQILIRENLKVNLGNQDNGKKISEKTKILKKGEVIKLLSSQLVTVEYSLSSPLYNSNSSHSLNQSFPPSLNHKYNRFLKCQTSSNEIILINIESKGKFSPIDKKDSISGVHTVFSLLSKRLPLMVRLVHGKYPSNFKSFVPEMRLHSVFEEDYLIAMPLHKKNSITSVPLNASLKLIGPKNNEQLSNHPVFSKLNQRLYHIISGNINKIQIYDSSMICKDLKNNWRDLNQTSSYTKKFQNTFTSEIRDKKVDYNLSDLDQNKLYKDEIDQIYDYIRGLAPLPEKYQNSFTKVDTYFHPKISYSSFHGIIDSMDKLCDKKSKDNHSYIQVSSNNEVYFSLNHQIQVSIKPKLLTNSCRLKENEAQSLPRIKKLMKSAKKISSNGHRVNVYDFNCSKLICSSVNSLIKAPIFSIRYKSLDDLHFTNPLNDHFLNKNSNYTFNLSNLSEKVSTESDNFENIFKSITRKNSRQTLMNNPNFETIKSNGNRCSQLKKTKETLNFKKNLFKEGFQKIKKISFESKNQSIGSLYL